MANKVAPKYPLTGWRQFAVLSEEALCVLLLVLYLFVTEGVYALHQRLAGRSQA